MIIKKDAKKRDLKTIATKAQEALKPIPHATIAEAANVSIVSVHNTLTTKTKTANLQVITATLDLIDTQAKKNLSLVKKLRQSL